LIYDEQTGLGANLCRAYLGTFLTVGTTFPTGRMLSVYTLNQFNLKINIL